MEIKIFVNNPWQENTVVLYDRTGEAVIIDCGCFSGEEERRLQDFLSQKKLKPVALLDTHLHIDHIFGNNFIKNTYGLSAQASKIIFWLRTLWSMPLCSELRGLHRRLPLGSF